MLNVIDIIKALVAAIVIMVVNVAISYVVVAIYAYLINPGHENAFYEAAAQDIAPWSSVVAGGFLFFGAGYLCAKRRPDRDAVLFAAAIWTGYLIVEFIILSGAGALTSMIGIVSLSLGTKLIAAIAGAKLGTRK